MLAWERLGRAEVDGGGVMELFRRGGDFAIRVDGRELMSSRMHGSEDALAERVFDRLRSRGAPTRPLRALVGGLGMGFTLAAALRRMGPDDRAEVAELVAEVIAWNEPDAGPVAAVAGRPLADPRVRARCVDVGAVIREAAGAWDGIMLDVDNGPDGLSRPGNDWLYSPEGLRDTGRALRPGGVVAWWSAAPDAAFTRRLTRAGFVVAEETVRAHGNKGARHTLWFGTLR